MKGNKNSLQPKGKIQLLAFAAIFQKKNKCNAFVYYKRERERVGKEEGEEKLKVFTHKTH